MASLAVTKCQSAGNDFVLLDRTSGFRLNYPELAQTLCDRHFGVGGDGLLVLERPADPRSDVAMLIFNADGSQAEMCGNGVRCVARFLRDRRQGSPQRLAIETTAGVVHTEMTAGAAQFAVQVLRPAQFLALLRKAV